MASSMMARSLNVFGRQLEMANAPGEPTTGFFRDGYCNTGPSDMGTHTVAAVVNQDWLDFSASQGNDLRGIAKPGCTWCLCVNRWFDAFNARSQLGDKVVPKVKLDATHEKTLQTISIEDLRQFAATPSSTSGSVGRDDGSL